MEAEEIIRTFPEEKRIALQSNPLALSSSSIPLLLPFPSPPKIEPPSSCIDVPPTTSFVPDNNHSTISTTTSNTSILDEMMDGPQITIDPRSLLEVADKHHRYGKNLRLYFKEYNLLYPFHFTTNYHTFQDKLHSYQPFFNWLDSPIQRPPELPDCNYSMLDHDTVEYLTEETDRMKYKYFISSDGLLTNALTGSLLTSSSKGDMFVLKNKCFYICEKKTKTIPRFHHSSFFGGDSVNAAGIIITENGKIKTIFPHSGHYRPEDKHLLWLIEFLLSQNLNIAEIQVDAQRVYKVSRHNNLSNSNEGNTNGPKAKKMDCLYLLDGQSVLYFLRHKFQAQLLGVLDDIVNFPKELLHHQPEPVVMISYVLVLPTPPPASPAAAMDHGIDEVTASSSNDNNEDQHDQFTPLTRHTTTFPAVAQSPTNNNQNSDGQSPAILATNPATPICPSPQRSLLKNTGINAALTVDTAPIVINNNHHNNNDYLDIPMSCPVYAQHSNHHHQQTRAPGTFLSPSAFSVSHTQSSDLPSRFSRATNSRSWTPPTANSSSSFPLATTTTNKSRGFSYYSRIPRRQRSNSMKSSDEWEQERDINMLLSESPVPNCVERKKCAAAESNSGSERRASMPASLSMVPNRPVVKSPIHPPSSSSSAPIKAPVFPLLPLEGDAAAVPMSTTTVALPMKSDLSRLLQEDSADCSLYSTTNDTTSRDHTDESSDLTSRKPLPTLPLACVTEESIESIPSNPSHQSASAPGALVTKEGEAADSEGDGDGKTVDDQLVYHDAMEGQQPPHPPPAHPAHCHAGQDQLSPSLQAYQNLSEKLQLLSFQQQQQQQQLVISLPPTATSSGQSVEDQKSPSSRSIPQIIVSNSFSRATSAANLTSLLASSSSPVLHS